MLLVIKKDMGKDNIKYLFRLPNSNFFSNGRPCVPSLR